MNILVVGRGDGGKNYSCGGHRLHFVDTPPKGNSAPDLEQYDFAFFHFSHDKERAEKYADVLDSWKKDGMLHKVIFISAGTYPYKWEDNERIRELGDIPFLEGIYTPQDVRNLPWENVQVDFKGDSRELFSLLSPRQMQGLIALIILCQAYLTAYAFYFDKEVKEQDVLTALDQMEFKESIKEMKGKLNKRDVEKNWENVQTGKWWWEVFAGDKETAVESMKEKIDQEWRDRPEVFNILFEMIEKEKVDNPSAAARVYLAISGKLGGHL